MIDSQSKPKAEKYGKDPPKMTHLKELEEKGLELATKQIDKLKNILGMTKPSKHPQKEEGKTQEQPNCKQPWWGKN